MLDYNKPTPPLPASCVALTERFTACFSELRRTTESQQDSVTPTEMIVEAASVNQLTINEYLPGQGIAPHTGE
jgi:hypothetical protein